MPYREISYSSLDLGSETQQQSPTLVTTALGNAILEIQGELVLPTEKPQDLSPEEEGKYVEISQGHAVRFGRLELDDTKATLFIGTSQRLIGEVQKLKPPLALMKFPTEKETSDIQIVDVIKYKIIFTGRPLPIM